MILGLDISTSITGYAILDDKGKTVENGAWDLRKYKDFFQKSKVIKEHVNKIYTKYQDKIVSVHIEQSLQSFRSGFSSAKTLSTLSRFNGVVSWLVYDLFKIKPEYIAATTARKLCGIKIPRGQKAKTVVLNYLLENEESFQVEYTKFGNPRPESYDKADSLVIAKAGYFLNKENKK
tara:strand:- start:75 stop:605 length:531 start_codon:yes stop_codon:yes gene_type:complete